jgi:hypothetical protein
MYAMKEPDLNQVLDRARREADPNQLRVRDVASLSASDMGDRGLDFARHVVPSSGSAVT